MNNGRDCSVCGGDPRAKYHAPDCDYARRPRTVRPIPVGIQGAGDWVDAGPTDNSADLAAMMRARQDFRDMVEQAIETGDSSAILARIERHIDESR